MSEAREYRVAVVPGDGIGREVIPEGIKVLDALVAGRDDGLSFTYDYYPWGAQYYLEAGVIMDDGGLDLLREVDAIYFGAAGWPEVPDHLQLYGFRLVVCRGFDLFASVRPIKLFPGVTGPIRDTTPDNVDFVVVRENSEGEYAGNGGRNLSGRGAGKEIALETSIFTEEGCERILRYGFEVARRRPRKKLASITKSNALQYGMSLWDDCYERVRQDYPDVESEQVLVDAMAARMVLRPDSLDVLVASNLFGDILSDLGGGIGGSLGIAASGNIDPFHRYPSMFEPVHGSAPDIAGKGIANPIAAVWSAAMMLDHLGLETEAAQIMTAIDVATASGVVTGDLGGAATTTEAGDAIADAI